VVRRKTGICSVAAVACPQAQADKHNKGFALEQTIQRELPKDKRRDYSNKRAQEKPEQLYPEDVSPQLHLQIAPDN
jgi:hypothetical protein